VCYLKIELDQFICEFSIPKRIHIIIRDAALVMRKTARLLETNSFDCILHMIQLAIHDGLKLEEIKQAVTNAKKLLRILIDQITSVKFFTRSKREEAKKNWVLFKILLLDGIQLI